MTDLPTCDKPELPRFHALVRFGAGIPAEAQGPAMLAFMKRLRELGAIQAEVLKDTMPDDIKRRSLMTVAERDKL